MSDEFRGQPEPCDDNVSQNSNNSMQVRSLSPVLNQHLPLCLVSCLFSVLRNERMELDMQVLLVDERQLRKKGLETWVLLLKTPLIESKCQMLMK